MPPPTHTHTPFWEGIRDMKKKKGGRASDTHPAADQAAWKKKNVREKAREKERETSRWMVFLSLHNSSGPPNSHQGQTNMKVYTVLKSTLPVSWANGNPGQVLNRSPSSTSWYLWMLIFWLLTSAQKNKLNFCCCCRRLHNYSCYCCCYYFCCGTFSSSIQTLNLLALLPLYWPIKSC